MTRRALIIWPYKRARTAVAVSEAVLRALSDQSDARAVAWAAAAEAEDEGRRERAAAGFTALADVLREGGPGDGENAHERTSPEEEAGLLVRALAVGLTYIARACHVIGFHLTQEARV